MKPGFALTLNHDGIGLVHRTAQGWLTVGDVALDHPGLTQQLRYLRKTALGLSPQGFATKLILPESQILYAEIDAPGPDRASRRAQIVKALEGRTPYAVRDLVFDWSGTGKRVQVAVVARVTLEEAEAFAEEHRFNPVSFVAVPPPGQFGGEPFFGETSKAASHMPAGERLARDQDPVRVIGAAIAAGPMLEPDTTAPDAPAEGEAEPAGVAAGPLPAETPAEPVDETTGQTEVPIGVATAQLPAEPADAALEETPAEPATKAMGEAETPSASAAPDAGTEVPEIPAETASPPEGPGQVVQDEIPAPEDMPVMASAEEIAAEPHAVAETTSDNADGEAPFIDMSDVEDEAAPAPVNTAAETATRPDSVMADTVATEPAVAPEGTGTGAALGAAMSFATRREAAPAFAPTERVPGERLAQQPLRLGLAAQTQAGKAPKLGGADKPAGITDPALPVPPAPEAIAKPAIKVVPTASVAGPAAPQVAASGIAAIIKPEMSPRLARAAAEARQTVFGARRNAPGRGRALVVGLALTAVLLLFMAAVALWSFWSESDTSAKTDVPVVGETAVAAEQPTPPDAVVATNPAAAEPDTAAAPRAETEVATATPVEAAAEPGMATSPETPEVITGGTEMAVAQALAASPNAAEGTASEVAALAPATDEAPVLRGISSSGQSPDAAPEGIILTAAPAPPGAPEPDATETLRRFGTDPETPLPAAPGVPGDTAVAGDVPPPQQPAPPPFGTVLRYGPDGQIVATPDGVVVPDGYTLYAALPPLVPPSRPDAVAAAPEATNPLADKRPRLRPEDLVAAPPPDAATPEAETALADPLVVDPTHAAQQPKARPEKIAAAARSVRATSEAVAAAAAAAAAAEAAGKAQAIAAASAQAVASSRRPEGRPSNFSKAVEAALATAVATPEPAPAPTPVAAAPTQEIDEPEPVAAAPSLPTRASVAKQATISNAISLSKVNLIGVYGGSKNRRALIRMPSGKLVKVKLGDRLDGGKVAAIGDSQLSYVKNGRTIVLQIGDS
jgi:hypothetical protein